MNLFGVLSEVYPTLLTGLTMTVKITILSLIIALVIGIFVCLMNISSSNAFGCSTRRSSICECKAG